MSSALQDTAALDPALLLRAGVEFLSQGRHAEALAAFDAVLALEPMDGDALNNRGCMLLELRRANEALESFELAISVRPAYAEAWRNRASALMALGRLPAALESVERAIALRPGFAAALADRVRFLVLLDRRGEAIASMQGTLRIEPGAAEHFRAAATRLAAEGRLAEALSIIEALLRAVPPLANLLNDKGDFLARLGRAEEALRCFDEALALRPDYAVALHNRGSILIGLQRYEEALTSLDAALKVRPDFVEALDHRGMVLEALQRFDEALRSFDDSLKIRPEYASAHWSQALCRLKLGDYRAGWQEYEWRWHVASLGVSRRALPGMSWTGRAQLQGRTILLYAEQGFGDTIQFARFVPAVVARGAKVILEAPAPLLPLMRSLEGVASFAARGDPLPPADFKCSLASLPQALGVTLETLPAHTPYLSPPSERVEYWRRRLPTIAGLRVGIVWSGSLSQRRDRRPIPLRELLTVLGLPNVEYVSLQKEVLAGEIRLLKHSGLIDLSAELTDFGETAAAVARIDLLITIDTSVAHLAGALGKPVWILLPEAADWRWLVERDDSPWYPQARLFRQRAGGTWPSLVETVRDALEARACPNWPADDAGWQELGNRAIRERRFPLAVCALRRAVELQPQDAGLLNDLGNALCEIDDHAEAESVFLRSLQLRPSYAEARSNLGTALRALGRLSEAEEEYRKALALDPELDAAYRNLANVLREMKRFQDSEAYYRRIAERNPADASAHNNLGNILSELGRLDEGEACYRRALQLRPGDIDSICNLGAALREQGRFPEAESQYREALRLKPDSQVAHSNLGNVLRDLGRMDEAEAVLRRAIALNPAAEIPYNVLGAVYRDIGRASEAAECFRLSIESNPDNADVHNNLANALGDLGRPAEAEASYRRAIDVKPDYAPARSNLLFMMLYLGTCTNDEYLAQAAAWERAIVPDEARARARGKVYVRAPRRGRRLRVGYVSGDFRMHAVSCFLEQIFEHHDKRRIEVFAYPTTGVEDAVTRRLQRTVDGWHRLAGLTDDKAVALIEQHGIDVLVDLSGHTAHNRLGIFARRAAPVQCQYLGYFATTGLTEMDYFVADAALVPSAHDNQYVEEVWRLPRAWVSYAPLEDAPAPDWQPGAAGRICFGSFNHLGKITERSVSLWARLMHRVPQAQLLLKTKELADSVNRSRIIARFGAHGIAAARLELLSRTPDWPAHMTLYNRVDVALDPVGGHGGATTTCDALWMGTPVVTLAGGRYGERMSHAILTAIGRGEWSAADEEQYIEKAVRLAADAAARQQIRVSLREQIRHGPLTDAVGLARALEDAYDEMFDRWAGRQGSKKVER